MKTSLRSYSTINGSSSNNCIFLFVFITVFFEHVINTSYERLDRVRAALVPFLSLAIIVCFNFGNFGRATRTKRLFVDFLMDLEYFYIPRTSMD